MSILDKFLNKRGIASPNELSAEEKATYEQWRLVLNKEELTLEDLKNFCKGQIDVIEGRWADLEVLQSKKAELLPYHTVYKLILSAIDSPKAARESLEKNLNQLINNV